MPSTRIPIYQVDAFTDVLFGGNPAAVCPLEYWPDKTILQAIAAENNLSETAFFVKEFSGYGLKWFTPKAEIDLCGHATLATAHILFEELGYEETTIRFFTNSGELTVTREGALLSLNFPSRHITIAKSSDEVSSALKSIPIELWQATDVIMAVFESEKDIVQLQPDFLAISKLPCRIVYVTAPGDHSDFVSRVFAPAVGVNEDPVTGSAHCYFIPYWSNRLKKIKLTAIQVSERRGILVCEYCNDRVKISGRSILYLKGEIAVTI
jgi:PhzF family phenazine biosynthesis protein